MHSNYNCLMVTNAALFEQTMQDHVMSMSCNTIHQYKILQFPIINSIFPILPCKQCKMEQYFFISLWHKQTPMFEITEHDWMFESKPQNLHFRWFFFLQTRLRYVSSWFWLDRFGSGMFTGQKILIVFFATWKSWYLTQLLDLCEQHLQPLWKYLGEIE